MKPWSWATCPSVYYMTTADIEMEQELSRPYVYLPRRDFVGQPGALAKSVVSVQQYTGASQDWDNGPDGAPKTGKVS